MCLKKNFILVILLMGFLIDGCTNSPSDQDGLLESEADVAAPNDDLDAPEVNSENSEISQSEGAEQKKDEFFDLGDNSKASDQKDQSKEDSSLDGLAGDSKLDQELKDSLPNDPVTDSQENSKSAQNNNEPPENLNSSPVDGTDLSSSGQKINITGLKYKANDAGGTVVIEADGPLTYTSRKNEQNNQLVIEIPKASLAKKLKRGLNTKDMIGSIGSVDAYQNANSEVARVVIQLRKNSPEPTVQQEGNSILVMGNAGGGSVGSDGDSTDHANQANGSNSNAHAINENGGDHFDPDHQAQNSQSNSQSNSLIDNNNVAAQSNEANSSNGGDNAMLKSHNLAEFLSSNTKFYGKKISIELDDVEVRDVLKFIIQESGANMVISDDVKGKVNLKLRQVPWDQALMTVMKVRKLGYTRQGNILRIAPVAELKSEEDDFAKAEVEKRKLEPLKVRMFPINYAKATEIQPNLKEFLTEGRGKALADPRTNYLVISDIEENLDRIAKLIASLDVQPPQILIEGKIVEAKESFVRDFGVTWSFSGQATQIAKGKNPLSLTPQLSVNPGSTPGGNLNFSLQMGTLDILGDLGATLNLAERDETVKVISSPRIVMMSNTTGSIMQSTQLPYTSFTNSNGTTTTSTSFKALNMSLKVGPQVTSDGSVIMKVEVMREFPGAGQGNGSTDFSVNSRSADTNVLVRNGQTAVIGGIYQSDATETDVGVPFLKDLPGIGALFRTKSWRKEKAELLVFLTPRILGQADSQAITPGNKEAL